MTLFRIRGKNSAALKDFTNFNLIKDHHVFVFFMTIKSNTIKEIGRGDLKFVNLWSEDVTVPMDETVE